MLCFLSPLFSLVPNPGALIDSGTLGHRSRRQGEAQPQQLVMRLQAIDEALRDAGETRLGTGQGAGQDRPGLVLAAAVDRVSTADSKSVGKRAAR